MFNKKIDTVCLNTYRIYRITNWFLPSSSMKSGMGCRRADCVIVSGGETALLFICSYFVREYTSIVCSDWWFSVRASANVFFFAIGISTSVIIFCGKNREMRVMHVLWNSWNWDLWMRIKSRSIWRRSFSNETEKLSVYR